jgi:dynein heavy chain
MSLCRWVGRRQGVCEITLSMTPHRDDDTQERLDFGTVGWNVPHVFPAADLAIARLQLSTLVAHGTDQEGGHHAGDKSVARGPLEAFQFMVAQCFYGGRVTDAWDRRALGALLAELVRGRKLRWGCRPRV